MGLVLLAAAALLLLMRKGPGITGSSADVPRTASSTYPMPPAGPSGSPGGTPKGAFGTVLTAYQENSDKVAAGISSIIDAARATDQGEGFVVTNPAGGTSVVSADEYDRRQREEALGIHRYAARPQGGDF